MKQKKDEVSIRSSAAEYLTYVASAGDQQDSIEMRYEDENIWLTQKMMAELYDVDVRTINKHIKKIYSDSELEEDETIRNFRIVQTEGSRQVTRDTRHYNLQRGAPGGGAGAGGRGPVREPGQDQRHSGQGVPHPLGAGFPGGHSL